MPRIYICMSSVDCCSDIDIKLCPLEWQLHYSSCWRNSKWVSIWISDKVATIVLLSSSNLILPTSLSSPRVPDISIFGDVIGDAFALALVAYAISISLGKTFALKHGYKVDSNQVIHRMFNHLSYAMLTFSVSTHMLPSLWFVICISVL